MEIYNEKVRDLLKDGTERQNLPLLDDPERGTVAEGLSEEWPRSEQHLCQLLRQIEARRTVHLAAFTPSDCQVSLSSCTTIEGLDLSLSIFAAISMLKNCLLQCYSSHKNDTLNCRVQ